MPKQNACPVGVVVKFVGPQERPELEGSDGVVVHTDNKANGFLEVAVTGGTSDGLVVNVKEDSVALAGALLTPGAKVTIRGLEKRSDLNGKHAVCERFKRDSLRWVVNLVETVEASESKITVKPVNLWPAQEEFVFPTEPSKRVAAVGSAKKRLEEALDAQLGTMKELNAQDEEFGTLIKTLDDLPKKLTHQVMVPFGQLAFFEGHLKHTNEILVQLSSEWFAERTASNACAFAERKRERLKKTMEDVQTEIDLLKQSLGLAKDEAAEDFGKTSVHADDDGFMNIREPVTEEDAERQKIGSDAKYLSDTGFPANANQRPGIDWKRLQELEALEQDEDEEESELDEGESLQSPSSQKSVRDSVDEKNRKLLEDEKRLKELDDLLEAADKIVSPRGATGPFDSGFADDARPRAANNPADLYRLMQDRVDSAMGGVGYPAHATTMAAFTGQIQERSEPAHFTGSIQERNIDSMSSQTVPSNTSQQEQLSSEKPISKFKAAKMKEKKQQN